MKRIIIITLLSFVVGGCGPYEYEGDPLIQEGLTRTQILNEKADALRQEIEAYNQREANGVEQVKQLGEQLADYRKRNNAFIMSLNEEQLELYKKVETASTPTLEPLAGVETGSASLSAGVILAFRNFEESLSEEELQTWIDLSTELLKLEEKRQELVVIAVNLEEQRQKLNQRRQELAQAFEMERQNALMLMKLLPYKWQAQQRAADRMHDAQQRQLDRMYYRQPPVFYGQPYMMPNQGHLYIPYDPRTDPWQYLGQGMQNMVDGLNK